MNALTNLLVNANSWAKSHDLSNWGVVIFTVILWPTVLSLGLLWWSRRKVNNISGLMISFTPSPGVAMGGNFPAVTIFFENQTSSVVYVNGPQIRNCTERFQIPTEAVRDIGENAHPLSFLNRNTGIFEDHQTTLQTSGKAETVIAVTTQMPQSFYRYKTSLLRRIFRRPNYFIIEYTAMVGDRKYSVSTVY
jgi:hypothetical protein